MKKITAEYSCDSCGTKVKKSTDLRQFDFELVRRGRILQGARTDLCDDCEAEILAAVERFFPGEMLGSIHAMRREDA